MKWADFIFPPINLWCYPKQYEDYKMINEETTVKPLWKYKQVENTIQVGGDHYKNMAVQPWEVMEAVLPKEEFIGFLKGNVIKYSMRDGKKENAHEDAEKARHYMAKLIEVQRDV